MKSISLLVLGFLLVVLFFSPACKKSTEPDSELLLKATFTNDWLCAECGEGIIFISDMDGTVLAEATWTGNASLKIKPPADLDQLPDKISVTTVAKNKYGDLILTTNLYISPDLSWTWKIAPLPDFDNPVGSLSFDFQNIPDHNGYSISSRWNDRYSSSGTLPSSYIFSVYESPVNIFLKLNTTNAGVKYLMRNDLYAGYNLLDLSSLQSTVIKTVEIPTGSGSIMANLYGFHMPGSFYQGCYLLDRLVIPQSAELSLTFHYPLSVFTDYRTVIYLYDPDQSNNFWYYSVYGSMPNSFNKINADFSIVDFGLDNFRIQTTGSFDQLRSVWRQSGNDIQIWWYVYGPPQVNEYALPELPNSVTQKYPDLNRESFTLYFADLIDYSQLNSYEEILDIMFRSPEYFFDVVSDYKSRVKYHNLNLKVSDTNGPDKILKRSDEYEYYLP